MPTDQPRRLSRATTQRSIAVGLCIAVMVPLSALPAPANDEGESPPANIDFAKTLDLKAQEYAEDTGVSKEEATEAMRFQGRVLEFMLEVQTEYPDEFVNYSIDHQTRTASLHLAEGADTEEIMSLADEALRDDVRVSANGSFSHRAAADRAAEITRRLEAAPHIATKNVRVDPATGNERAIVVGRGDAQEVRAVAEAPGLDVVFSDDPIDTNHFDTVPLGGSRVHDSADY